MNYKATVSVASFVVTAVTGVGYPAVVLADLCPIPMGSIDPKIDAQVAFDSSSQLYIYQYTVSNGAEALIPFNRFRLFFSDKAESVQGPPRWREVYLDKEFPGLMTWDTAAVDTITERGIRMWPSPYAIFPGKSMSGFIVKSKFPPGVIRFVASGIMTQVPKADPDPTGRDDEPVPKCPGMDFYNDEPYGDDVSGTTVGPVRPSAAISLRLKIKPPKKPGEAEAAGDDGFPSELVVNPEKDRGALRAELSGDKGLSSEDFDISTVNVASLTLGQGKAPATKSQVVGKKLKLEFDLAKVAIRCDLDQALFLEGNTKDGKQIQASMPLKKFLCKHTRETKRIDLTPRPKKPKRPRK